MIDIACSVFLTGTDTGVGKTHVAVALLRQWAGQGLRVAAMKTVAAGRFETTHGPRNDDALELAAAQSAAPKRSSFGEDTVTVGRDCRQGESRDVCDVRVTVASRDSFLPYDLFRRGGKVVSKQVSGTNIGFSRGHL